MICKKKLNIEDLDRTHRIGKVNNGKSRPIIVKFARYNVRKKPTNNADLTKFNYSCYSIEFYSRLEFVFREGSFGENVIIFEVDLIYLFILIIKIKIS